MKFCSRCGAMLESRIPPGDNRARQVCAACGSVHYRNPRLIVGCVAEWEQRVLLCRRAIEPRYGTWTLPAGFMEEGESTEEGAARETWEEARARVEIVAPFTLMSVPHIDQVHLYYRAHMIDDSHASGEESLDVGLFSISEIPWDVLAFRTVRETLTQYCAARETGVWGIHTATLGRS